MGGGGRLASVQHATRIKPRPLSSLCRTIGTRSPCDLVEGFSYVYPPKPLSPNISCISQSAAARHPSQLDGGLIQSRTFFVLSISLLMDWMIPRGRVPKRLQLKPRYRPIQTSPAQSPLACCSADQNTTSPVSVHKGIPTPWFMTSPRLASSNIALADFLPGL